MKVDTYMKLTFENKNGGLSSSRNRPVFQNYYFKNVWSDDEFVLVGNRLTKMDSGSDWVLVSSEEVEEMPIGLVATYVSNSEKGADDFGLDGCASVTLMADVHMTVKQFEDYSVKLTERSNDRDFKLHLIENNYKKRF